MIKSSILSIFIAATLITLTACCPCEKSKHETQPKHSRTEISYRSGGGFSGYYSGVDITSERLLLSYNGRPGTRDNLDTLARMAESEYADLLDRLYAMAPQNIQHQESGNMTTVISITSGDETWTWTWPGTQDDDEQVPESLRPLRNLLREVIQSNTHTNDGTD
jgi:hypothetical protein